MQSFLEAELPVKVKGRIQGTARFTRGHSDINEKWKSQGDTHDLRDLGLRHSPEISVDHFSSALQPAAPFHRDKQSKSTVMVYKQQISPTDSDKPVEMQQSKIKAASSRNKKAAQKKKAKKVRQEENIHEAQENRLAKLKMIVEENLLTKEEGRPASRVVLPKQTDRVEKEGGKDSKGEQGQSVTTSLSKFTVKANT